MSSTKGFLIAFAIAYVVLAGGGLSMWGPPGYSVEYMEDHKTDHEKYLATTKSTVYKQFMQHGDAEPTDPALVELAEPLTEQAAFVVDYTATPEFIAETKRRAIYGYYFGFLNAGSLILIAFRFGRKPIAGMLDAQIAEIRDRLDRADAAKAKATTRLESAQARVGGLAADEAQAKKHADELMVRERRTLEEGTEHALAFIDQETEERKAIVAIQAVKTIRKELVEQAASAVVETYQSQRNAATEAGEINSFIGGLNRHAAQETVAK